MNILFYSNIIFDVEIVVISVISGIRYMYRVSVSSMYIYMDIHILLISALKMEAVCAYETSSNLSRFIRCKDQRTESTSTTNLCGGLKSDWPTYLCVSYYKPI
jgi:hypothetical protein